LFGGFNGFNCRYYLSVFVFNDKFNLSLAMRFARFGVGGFKGCFDVGNLQAKLEDDIGFIEQIDIDEMSELVGDLQADKKYYQTNIALAREMLPLRLLELVPYTV
jgi:hypothetical protein